MYIRLPLLHSSPSTISSHLDSSYSLLPIPHFPSYSPSPKQQPEWVFEKKSDHEPPLINTLLRLSIAVRVESGPCNFSNLMTHYSPLPSGHWSSVLTVSQILSRLTTLIAQPSPLPKCPHLSALTSTSLLKCYHIGKDFP